MSKLELMIFVVLWLILNVRDADCVLNTTRIAEIMSSYNSSYQIRIIPSKKGKHIDVLLDFYIYNMVPLTFVNDHIFMEIELMEKWVDERLRYKSTSSNDMLTLQNEDVTSVWIPDIFIMFETGEQHKTFPINRSCAYIFPNGTVVYYNRLSVSVYCPMSMRMFPFDRQRCPIKFESFGYNNELLKLGLLRNESVTDMYSSEDLKISRFLLHHMETFKNSTNYGLSGTFDQVMLLIFLSRDIRYYIMEYYFPVVCVVFLSFISFWIHYKATPARVALPVTSFLTLTTILEHVRSSSSIIGTAAALEIFLNVSNFFVFANLLQYAFVGVTERHWLKMRMRRGLSKSKTKYRRQQINKNNGNRQEDENNIKEYTNDEDIIDRARQNNPIAKSNTLATFADGMTSWIEKKNEKYYGEMHYLDRICRYVFPLFYASFLLVYSVVCAVYLLK